MMNSDNNDDQVVGARQSGMDFPPEGGGSLDYCTKPEFGLMAAPKNFSRDPRLQDLERIGLGSDWLALAQEIGVDNFLIVWRFMSARRDVYRRVTTPDYGSYERYQRNCYIRSLSNEGKGVKEIRSIVAKVLGEYLSERTILRATK